MTKKSDYRELSTPADLTQASYENAHQYIVEVIIDAGITKGILRSDHHVLTIASQNIGVAAALMMTNNFTLDFDPSYGPDEWSLTRHHMLHRTGTEPYTPESITVWSPGA